MRRERARALSPLISLLLRFLGIFVVVLIVLALAWPLIVPTYTKLVTVVARVGFHIVESPDVSVLDAQSGELWVYRIIGEGAIKPFTWFDRYTYFALIPLVALFAATPGLGWIKRITRLGLSVVLLFFIHVSYLVISVQLSYAAIGLTDVGPFVARMLTVVQWLVRVLWEAAPLVLWVAFTARTWAATLRGLRSVEVHDRAPRRRGRALFHAVARKGWES